MKHILMARVIALLLTFGLAQAMYADDQTQHKNQLVVKVSGGTETTYNLSDSPVITFSCSEMGGE